MTTATAPAVGKNYFTNDGGAGVARYYSWVVLATIRLKDIADFFDKIPLVKGAFMRMTINYNSFSNILTGAGGTWAIKAAGVTSLSGRTNPMLVSNAAANNSGNGFSTAGDVLISCGVATNPLLNAAAAKPSLPISSCRLYVPAYIMNPTYESQLISIAPVKEVVYTDIYNFNFGSYVGGSSFNQILKNGIVNPKQLILIPFATPGAAGGANSLFANVSVPTYQSPFDTAPGTTTPMAAITQFQVQVGGQNMFQQNFQYDFESFINEVSAANAINGGLSTGITNGLIGHYEFDNAYRYYVCDISRRLPSEDNVPKSIVVQGIVNAPNTVSLDFVCFVVYERKIRINMLTGAIVDS